ncbi:MAG: DoxX family protein [Candidatus Angelobacter sp.]
MSTAATNSQPVVVEQTQPKGKTASKGMVWTGRVLSVLTVLFMLFDAVGKFMMPPQVVEACARLGIPVSQAVSIGVLLLVSTIIYAIPRTAVLGAVLLTGYLGGAVAIQMRAGSSVFETVFPVLFGVIVWAGVYLRECGLRRVFPIFR